MVSVLVVIFPAISFRAGIAGFLCRGAGTGGMSSPSSPPELDGGVNSVGPSESSGSLCRRVDPESSRARRASNVASHCEVLTCGSVCGFRSSGAYALVNKPLTAANSLSTQLKCNKLW